MTTNQPDPPLAGDEVVSAGGERDVLEAFLDLYRGVVARKLAGLSADQARLRLVPSATTLAGVVQHLASVEREWFQSVLAGRPTDEADPVPPGDGWVVGPEVALEDVLEDYAQACARSRQVASELALGDTVPHARLGRVSLRWVYVHLIEETARHAVHADVLRELTDGATGFVG